MSPLKQLHRILRTNFACDQSLPTGGGADLHLCRNIEGYLAAKSPQKWLRIHAGLPWVLSRSTRAAVPHGDLRSPVRMAKGSKRDGNGLSLCHGD
jgi:hypothetical protein